MLWAIGSSVFVIYLYRQLNAVTASPAASDSADTVETELAALNASIAALESKMTGPGSGSAKP